MNKQEPYDFLDRSGIGYEITEHAAVYNMAELGRFRFLTLRPMPRIFSFGMIRSAITT